jgi:hypothetical protein
MRAKLLAIVLISASTIGLLAARAFGSEKKKSAASLPDILKNAGVKFEVVPGWETRGRSGFHPIGIMLHHTATTEPGDAPSLPVVINGRSDLKGPLAQLLLGRSGKAYLVAANLANHAGQGSKEVLDLVRSGQEIRQDAKEAGRKDSVVGNEFFYGIEVENSGLGEPYPEEQIRALVQICAAILRAHGWGAERVIHHRQWTQRKTDMSYRGDLREMIRKAG